MNSGIPNDHPLAQQLVRDGRIPLTDDSLRTYMRLLAMKDFDYLQHVTTDLLERVAPLASALDSSVPPAYHDRSV